MADFSVPLNRVGVVRATLIDLTGSQTPDQMDSVQWSITGGGSSYFNLVVAADGLSAEIHPTAEGSGSVRIEASQVGEASVVQTRTVEIVSNSSDPASSGPYPHFIGTTLSIVTDVGELV